MSSLLDKLQKGGSNLTAFDGTTPRVNPGATKQSKLHASNQQPGYSLDGAFKGEVTTAYNSYLDGVTTNKLPQPSQLDLNGKIPANNYLSNPPEQGISQRLVDLTPPR